MLRRFCLLAAALLCLSTLPSLATGLEAGEIGYIEDYSLSTDRTVPLQQLIPGTEDYYYYHALHYLSLEQWAKVAGRSD